MDLGCTRHSLKLWAGHSGKVLPPKHSSLPPWWSATSPLCCRASIRRIGCQCCGWQGPETEISSIPDPSLQLLDPINTEDSTNPILLLYCWNQLSFCCLHLIWGFLYNHHSFLTTSPSFSSPLHPLLCISGLKKKKVHACMRTHTPHPCRYSREQSWKYVYFWS